MDAIALVQLARNAFSLLAVWRTSILECLVTSSAFLTQFGTTAPELGWCLIHNFTNNTNTAQNPKNRGRKKYYLFIISYQDEPHTHENNTRLHGMVSELHVIFAMWVGLWGPLEHKSLVDGVWERRNENFSYEFSFTVGWASFSPLPCPTHTHSYTKYYNISQCIMIWCTPMKYVLEYCLNVRCSLL